MDHATERISATENRPETAPPGLTPLAVANYFIKKSPSGIKHLKLQKLVYCAQGWWLAYARDGDRISGRLFAELPEAWTYGPVYSSLYRALKNKKIHTTPARSSPSPWDEDSVGSESLTGNTAKLLNWVYERYQDIGGMGMSFLTHKEGTPWHQITDGGKDIGSSKEIPEDMIANEFSVLLERERQRG